MLRLRCRSHLRTTTSLGMTDNGDGQECSSCAGRCGAICGVFSSSSLPIWKVCAGVGRGGRISRFGFALEISCQSPLTATFPALC
jgi:hypothetical protein